METKRDARGRNGQDTRSGRQLVFLVEHRTALDTLTADLLNAETLDGSVVRLALERSPAAA